VTASAKAVNLTQRPLSALYVGDAAIAKDFYAVAANCQKSGSALGHGSQFVAQELMLIKRIASDAVLDEAYDWLCRRWRDFPAARVWEHPLR
jgi:hypothetical protein